jgi:hypothetical protein
MAIDAYKSYAILFKKEGSIFCQKGMAGIIGFCIPVSGPSGVDEYGFAEYIKCSKEFRSYCMVAYSGNDNARKVCDLMDMDFRKVTSVSIPVKWAIHIGARIGYHIDTPDLKCSAFFIVGSRCFTAEVITDVWSRKSAIGYQAVEYGVAEVDVVHA